MSEECRSLAGDDVPLSLLGPGGGPLPRRWHGADVTVELPPASEHDGPVPRSGWRTVREPAGGVLLAAPAPGRDDERWWTCWLRRSSADGWIAQVGWPEELLPARVTLAEQYVLQWPAVDSWPLRDLDRLQVRVVPLDPAAHPLSDLPATHVVGHVLDAESFLPLPHEPWQVFAGFGPAPVVDGGPGGLLPVRWLLDDRGSLRPGRYALRATLTSLSLGAPTWPVRLT